MDADIVELVQPCDGAIELLRCAADLLIKGEPFPFIDAVRQLNPSKKAVLLAEAARKHLDMDNDEVQLLEAALLLEEGWRP